MAVIVLGFDAPGIPKHNPAHGAFAIYNMNRDRIIHTEALVLPVTRSERMHYRDIRKLLDALYKRYKFTLVSIEHPFLYKIAQWVGAVKFWASQKRGLTWYMITASSAKKTLQMKHKASKDDVMRRMVKLYPNLHGKTQHEVDAAMYAIAAPLKLWESRA